MLLTTRVFSLLSLLSCGAIFGFFYAWVCSTMWGLDQADPRVAIEAMQAMNASVRNAVFAPAFFGTPIILATAAIAAYLSSCGKSAIWFAVAAFTYLCFGLLLTMMVNVPMNEALAFVKVSEDIESARQIWQYYSPEWQFWNIARTIASGFSLLMCGIGVLSLKPA